MWLMIKEDEGTTIMMNIGKKAYALVLLAIIYDGIDQLNKATLTPINQSINRSLSVVLGSMVLS